MKRILFVGGGSAGHIYPIVALMKELTVESKKVELHYVGENKDIALFKESFVLNEDQLESNINIFSHVITAGKINRYLTWKHVPQAGRFIKSLWQANRILTRVRPDIIFAKGGYVSVPVVLMASTRGIPIYGHETDVVPGLANRIVARYAKKVFCAFPAEYYREMPQDKMLYVGQPIRQEFFDNDISEDNIEPDSDKADRPLIVVIGGSQGAHRINWLVSEIWKSLLERADIIHLTGVKEYEEILLKAKAQKIYENRLVIKPYDPDIPNIFRKATLVISRSGGTIFEIAAAGLPAILIPLSTSAQNHQLMNARVFEKAEAAIVLEENKINSDKLYETIKTLLEDKNKINQLADNIRKLAKPDAVKNMLKVMDI